MSVARSSASGWKRRFKVLHLPGTVGGNPQGLSEALCRLGWSSESWTIRQNHFAYPADRTIAGAGDPRWLVEIKKILALSYVWRFQVIFFNFGSTLFEPVVVVPGPDWGPMRRGLASAWRRYNALMQRLELWALRRLGRVLLVQYQGDDARQGDYCLAHFAITAATRVEPNYYTSQSDESKRRRIMVMARNCRKIYALNPDLLHVLPPEAEFMPYAHISLEEWVPVYTQLVDRPLRIGHAPSHRAVKGTDVLLAALDRLRQRGIPFELVLVEGRSHAEAKEIYKTVDVLVDQLFIGWYGGLAVEAMALGKPVVAYLREEDLRFLPADMRAELPVIRTTPDGIEETLERIIRTPRTELLELARRSRAFVERWHDPLAIAARVEADIALALANGRSPA